MPPKTNINVNSGPENSAKLKVTAASVPFLCSWIKVLGIWHPIDPKKFHDELQNGLLLCRITEMLVPGTRLEGINKKPLTERPCIKNLELALPAIWNKNPSPINMCTAQEFYDKKALTVSRCMLEIFKTLQVQQTRQQASEFLSDIDAGLAHIGRPLSQSTLTNPQTSPDLLKDFSDCTRLVAILVMRHKMKSDLVSDFWGHPTTKFQKMQNASNLVKALDAARAGGLFTANDWISPPEPCPETLLYVIHYTYNKLRLSRDCWDKDKADLSDMKFKDGVPLANPPVLYKPDEDEPEPKVGDKSKQTTHGGHHKKEPKKDVLSSPVKSSIAARKTAFVRTAAAIGNQEERCIMSPANNYSQSLQKEKNPKGQSLIRVASAPNFKDPTRQAYKQSEEASSPEMPSKYAQLRDLGVRSASTGRPGSAPGLASTAPANMGERYGACTPPPAARPASALQKWRPTGDTRASEPYYSSHVQLKQQRRQQESQKNQNSRLGYPKRSRGMARRRGPGSPCDGCTSDRSRTGGIASDPKDECRGEEAADQFLSGISAAIQRIDPYSLGKNWPRHWDRQQPRAINFQPLFNDQDGSWQGAPADITIQGEYRTTGAYTGDRKDNDYDSFGATKATPTTRIKAHVVCQDGSAYPARIYTNVVDVASTDGESVKMVVDFQSCEGGGELRIRADASFITDIKITSKGGGNDDNPSGTSYFLLLQKSGILHSSDNSGVQYMPMPENLAVTHVTVNRGLQEAENFFGELLILAQFLSATR